MGGKPSLGLHRQPQIGAGERAAIAMLRLAGLTAGSFITASRERRRRAGAVAVDDAPRHAEKRRGAGERAAAHAQVERLGAVGAEVVADVGEPSTEEIG